LRGIIYKIDGVKGIGLIILGNNWCECLDPNEFIWHDVCKNDYRYDEGDCGYNSYDMSHLGIGKPNPDWNNDPQIGGIGYTCEWKEREQDHLMCTGCPDGYCLPQDFDPDNFPFDKCTCEAIEYPEGTHTSSMCLEGNFEIMFCSYEGDPAYWESLGWTHMEFDEEAAWDAFNEENFFCTPCEVCPMPTG